MKKRRPLLLGSNNYNTFRVLDAAYSLISALAPLVAAVGRHERSLRDQLRRAGSSIPLNLAEGYGPSRIAVTPRYSVWGAPGFWIRATDVRMSNRGGQQKEMGALRQITIISVFSLTMTSCVRNSLPTVPSTEARPVALPGAINSNCGAHMMMGSAAVCSTVANDTVQTCLVDVGEYSARDCTEGAWPRLAVRDVLVLDSDTDRTERDHLQTYIQRSRGEIPTRVADVSTAVTFHDSPTFFVTRSSQARPRLQCWVAPNDELTCREFQVDPGHALFVVDGEPRDLRRPLVQGVYPSADGTRCLYEDGESWRRGDCQHPTSTPLGRVIGNPRPSFYDDGMLVMSMGGEVQWFPFDDEPARGGYFPDLNPLMGVARVGDHLLLSSTNKSLWVEFSTLEPIE